MRRGLRAAALVMALVLALGTVAAAANIEYDKDKNSSAANKNGIQVAPLDGCTVEFAEGSEMLTVTYTNDEKLNVGDMVIVLLLKSDKAVTDSDVAKNMTTTLTAGTIQYIDQADVTEKGKVEFTVFPQNYSNGVIRLIWKDKTSDGVNTATVAAVNRTYILGDVNSDGRINISDVADTLGYMVGKIANINRDAADVDGNGRINISDVSDILAYFVKGTPFKLSK